jgi:hypothetical protein
MAIGIFPIVTLIDEGQIMIKVERGDVTVKAGRLIIFESKFFAIQAINQPL